MESQTNEVTCLRSPNKVVAETGEPSSPEPQASVVKNEEGDFPTHKKNLMSFSYRKLGSRPLDMQYCDMAQTPPSRAVSRLW